MRRLLSIGLRFVVIFVVLWVVLFVILLAVLDLPFLFAFAIGTAGAGALAWFSLDLAFFSKRLEDDAEAALDDGYRRKFVDEVKRQGPGPGPRPDGNG
ncbi:MAG: hypothetical protein AAF962_07025 [Actinomycetota bacterium]